MWNFKNIKKQLLCLVEQKSIFTRKRREKLKTEIKRVFELSKNNCWDNAVAESFFKTLKTELIYHNKYQTRKELQISVFEYIETLVQ